MRSIQQIGYDVLTQDNRATSYPIFIVEERTKIYMVDEEVADGHDWLNVDIEEEADAVTAKKLDKLEERGLENPEWRKVFYIYKWNFVTACLTENGCKAFIQQDAHNHGELRIYAASGYKNEEWQSIRNFVMSQAYVKESTP